jgi:CheY-like chemotaxis protein
MTRIIDDLLDMSRIISGKIRLEAALFPFAQVLDDAVESVRLAAEAKDIAITRDVDPGLVLRGDAPRIQQVLWNLLANAVKFTPAGGTVAVAVRTVDGFVQVDVRDSGVGIAPDFVPYVFDRFRQADSSVTRPYGGLGLGLAIARELVELHGGRISVASDGEGRGACFSFTLPLPRTQAAPASTDPAQPQALPAPAGAVLAGVRVALVEDDADAHALVTAILTAHGASVRGATSANAGLALIDDECPDVLVSDIGMQGHDGYWLAGQLRRRPEDPARHLPAIALTAFAGEADRERAIAAGFDEHVAKPIDEQVLVRSVARLARRATTDAAG